MDNNTTTYTESETIKGISLVESLIIFTILAVLTSLAIPTYDEYKIRSKVTEATAITNKIKSSISEYIVMNKGKFPANNATLGINNDELLQNSSEYLRELYIANGTVTAMTQDTGASNELTIIYTPNYNAKNNSVSWSCSALGDIHYVPAACYSAAMLSKGYSNLH